MVHEPADASDKSAEKEDNVLSKQPASKSDLELAPAVGGEVFGGQRDSGELDGVARLMEPHAVGAHVLQVHGDHIDDAAEIRLADHQAAAGAPSHLGHAVVLEYAKQRVQFDVPIGSFQAIQHKLANMSLAVERAISATYYAAMAVDALECLLPLVAVTLT